MTEWVSQAEALRVLAEAGDAISQPALSQYLKTHGEVPRKDGGAGKPTLIDIQALLASRESRRTRGPASAPERTADPDPDAKPINPLGDRKARADVDRAEADARRARILADEAEGRTIPKDVAVAAFMTAGVELTRAMEEQRRAVVEAMRAARDPREADLAMRAYERAVRAAFSHSLANLAEAEIAQVGG